MKYIEAPTPYSIGAGDPPSVFLAGGITGCPNWQAQAAALLGDQRVVVINPNRKHFPIEDPNAADEQIRWEFDCLNKASVILFWFPDSGSVPQPIALYELGWYAAKNRLIVVGADPSYCRRSDVLIQMELGRPDVTVRATLEETVADAALLLDL